MTKQKSSKPKIDMPSKEQLEMVVNQPYSDEALELTPAMEAKVEKLMKYFDEAGINYDKFDPDDIPRLGIDFSKDAYPNYDQYMHIPGQHSTKKWLETVREIFRMEKDGANRVAAIRRATSGWNVMETFDFLNWLRYHESGEHLKYKFAQLWYENPSLPGYALHVKPDPIRVPEPQVTGRDIDFARESVSEELTKNERKQIIEKQRNKIIGRLDSAEKLLRSPDGQMFSGKEFESLLEAIYDLKKRIQMVNKISSSTRLYEDLIVRQANVLQRKGFRKAAEMLHSLAQTPGQSAGELEPITDGGAGNTLPPAAPPDDPSGAGNPGAPGGLPSMGPGMPQNAPSDSVPETGPNEMSPTNMQTSGDPTATTDAVPASPMPKKETPKSKGIADFLEGMNTAGLTSDEDLVHDELEVEDTISVAEADNDLMVVEGQAAPPVDVPMTDSPPPAPLTPAAVPAPAAPATEEPLEVTEDDIPAPADETAAPSAANFDAKVDTLFAHLSVADVVAKLEDLAKIFKVREVPRQLAVVDMMLDSLGLASYFPSLSEAQNKALESNNYISTRVEDILSKLRGAMTTKEIDLKGDETENPEVAGIKGKLQEDADKEKSRKKMRKEQEAAELEGATKETPEVEIAEDLGAPAAPAAPVAARPAPPPV